MLRWRRSVLDRATGAVPHDEIVLGTYSLFGLWVLAGLLTLGVLGRDPHHSFGRVAGMLLSVVLVHELGRVLAARLLHVRSRVVLRMLGPRTLVDERANTLRARALVVAMGTTSNAVFALIAIGLALRAPDHASTLRPLAFCHAAYGAAHLFPFSPFDAHVLVERLTPRGRTLLWVSLAGGLGLSSLFARVVLQAPYFALGCALLAFFPVPSIASALAESADQRRRLDERLTAIEVRIESDARADDRLQLHLLLRLAKGKEVRVRSLRALARIELALGHPAHAAAAMQQLPDDAVDVVMVASLLRLLGDDVEAIRLLEAVREAGAHDAAITKMLIDLHFARGDDAAVSSIATRDGGILSPEDRRRIADALGP